MAIDFPNSPTNGQIYTTAGRSWQYDGEKWINYTASSNITLGTDTSGNYVASLVAGTGISLANNTGEGATPTITNSGVTSINTTLTGAVTGVVTTSDTGTVTSTMITDGTIVNGDINASAGIALSKLASGTSGQVVLANSSGVPTYTTLTGDVTIDSSGATTIAANSVALGTDTTGNYMSGISGTSPVSVSHTPGEGSSASVSLATAYGDTQNPYGSKTANYFLASPDGSASVPSFRAMVNADIPSALTSKTYNGLTVTSTTGTFTLTNAKTLSVTNTLTLSGTDSTTMTFPATSSTVMTLATPGTLTGTLTLRAGTATAGTAPLYLQTGTNLTTAAAGAIEFDGTNLYFTPSTSRKTVAFTDSNITGTAANITASSNTSLTSLANLSTIGTLSSGSIPATLLTGTVASARISGSYTGITAVGGLGSLTVYGNIVGGAEVYASSWFRSYGSTGWYNQDYGGGIYMVDTTFVRVYNSKLFLATGIWDTSAATASLSGYNYVVRGATYGNYAYYTSNRANKRNIQDVVDSGTLIDQLRPVTFQEKILDTDSEEAIAWKNSDLEYGFIAEEVADVGTGFLAQYKGLSDGTLEPAGWKFHGVVSVLVAEVKALRQRVATLESTQ